MYKLTDAKNTANELIGRLRPLMDAARETTSNIFRESPNAPFDQALDPGYAQNLENYHMFKMAEEKIGEVIEALEEVK